MSRHRADCLVETAHAQRPEGFGVGRVEHVVLDGGIHGGALPSTFDEIGGLIERDDKRSELGHTPGKATSATGDIQNGLPGGNGQQPLSRGLDEQLLEVIPIAYAVVPPVSVGFPYTAILVRVLGKLGFVAFCFHVLTPPYNCAEPVLMRYPLE